MKIVSIYTGHNATIGYFEDGECKLILHEEKFHNIKNFYGFPELALSYMSRQVKFSDIDYFPFGQKYLMMAQAPTQKEDYFGLDGMLSNIQLDVGQHGALSQIIQRLRTHQGS